jgi:hypothetical protein
MQDHITAPTEICQEIDIAAMILAVTNEFLAANREERTPETNRALATFLQLNPGHLAHSKARFLLAAVLFLAPDSVVPQRTKASLLNQNAQLRRWVDDTQIET